MEMGGILYFLITGYDMCLSAMLKKVQALFLSVYFMGNCLFFVLIDQFNKYYTAHETAQTPIH
jgi:hypothetical protein